jgi:hypothetical protein
MANTVPFNVKFGIDVANNLMANSVSVTANGFVANSLGVTTTGGKLVNTKNVTANNFVVNNATYLSIIANLISQNVLTGNLETLKQLTANNALVNSVTANIVTMGNVTANQLFVNVVSGNTLSIPLTCNALLANSIRIGSNSTAQTIISNNGFYLLDTTTYSGGSLRHMPAEILLQRGVTDSTNNFFINCKAETESGLYKSYRLLLTNIIFTNTNQTLRMRFSQTGLQADTITTTDYSHAFVYNDGWIHPTTSGDEGLGVDCNSIDCIPFLYSQNTSVRGIAEIDIQDASATAGQKCCRFHSMHSYQDNYSGNTVAIIQWGGGHMQTSIVIKGIEIRCDGGDVACRWALIGRRHV